MSESERRRGFSWFWFAFFVLLTAGLATTGLSLYRKETESIRQVKENELHAVAELKVGQLETWRRERLEDARLLAETGPTRGWSAR